MLLLCRKLWNRIFKNTVKVTNQTCSNKKLEVEHRVKQKPIRNIIQKYNSTIYVMVNMYQGDLKSSKK